VIHGSLSWQVPSGPLTAIAPLQRRGVYRFPPLDDKSKYHFSDLDFGDEPKHGYAVIRPSEFLPAPRPEIRIALPPKWGLIMQNGRGNKWPLCAGFLTCIARRVFA